MRRAMIFTFLIFLGCSHVSSENNLLSISSDVEYNSGINKPVILIELPGIFNQATKFYEHPNVFWSKNGYECRPIDLPLRNVLFRNTPPPGLGEITIQDDCQFVVKSIRAIISCYPGFSFVLVGHSRGGLLAQMAAAELGEEIDALVLIDPAPPAGISSISCTGLKAFWPLLNHGISWRNQPIRRSFDSTCYAVLDPSIPAEEAWKIHQGLVWESGRVFWQLAFDKPIIDQRLIKCPVLVIAGARDRLVKVSTAKKVAEKYGADFIAFDTAHYPFYREEGQKVISFVVQWLKIKI